MFSVVQFFENSRFQVLAVPTSWIKEDVLLWPSAPNKIIEKLRTSGGHYEGKGRNITVSILETAGDAATADKIASDCAQLEVSDVEAKKRKLKPPRKPKRIAKDYNKMVADLQEQDSAGPSSKKKQSVKVAKKQHRSSSKPVPEEHTKPQVNSVEAAQDTLPSQQEAVKVQQIAQSQAILVHDTIPSQQNDVKFQQVAASQADLVQGAMPSQQQDVNQVDTSQLVSEKLPKPHQNSATVPSLLPLQVELAQNTPGTSSQSAKFVPSTSVVCTSTPTIIMNDDGNYCYEQVEVDGGYDLLKADLQHFIKETFDESLKTTVEPFIERTVQQAVDKAVAENFAKLATLIELNKKSDDLSYDWVNNPIANHKKIDGETDLEEWNAKLESAAYIQKYVQYFVNILPPETYLGKGNNALYTIADCLFTRKFFTKFTWTGISRGGSDKSKRGFREFSNVISLLQRIVSLADPEYTPHKISVFFKTKLLRYSKTRSTSKQQRKSSSRPLRTNKQQLMKKLELQGVTGEGNEDKGELSETDDASDDSYEDESDGEEKKGGAEEEIEL